MTDPKAILDRVEELDKSATPGPWTADKATVYFPRVSGGFDIRHCPSADANVDAIAEYRTLAPKLARALRIAVDALEKAVAPQMSIRGIGVAKATATLAAIAAELEP